MSRAHDGRTSPLSCLPLIYYAVSVCNPRRIVRRRLDPCTFAIALDVTDIFVHEAVELFLTSFCGFRHRLSDGKPVDHVCYVIPAEALHAEKAGDLNRFVRILYAWKKRRAHNGLVDNAYLPHRACLLGFLAANHPLARVRDASRRLVAPKPCDPGVDKLIGWIAAAAMKKGTP